MNYLLFALFARISVGQVENLDDWNKKQTMFGKAETIVDLVHGTGYSVDDHDVITEDEYIIIAHRLYENQSHPANHGKPVVLMISGIVTDTDLWMLRGPKKDLPYLLIEEGYDVWFLNVRGNFYCKGHKSLETKNCKFWDFSWHEHGIYDAAATVDYILKLTQKSKLSIIGHSMGTTVTSVLLSMKPEYNERVNVFIAFAPICKFTHSLLSGVGFIFKHANFLYNTLKAVGKCEVLAYNPMTVLTYKLFCENYFMRKRVICQKLINSVIGSISGDYTPIDPAVFHVFIHHYPHGTSIKTLKHFQQVAESGRFQQYDYGTEENYRRYNSALPPEYPLHKIVVPVFLYYGSVDAISTEQDARWIFEQLPNAQIKGIEKPFSHIDFLASKFTKELLYDDVIKTLRQYNSSFLDVCNNVID